MGEGNRGKRGGEEVGSVGIERQGTAFTHPTSYVSPAIHSIIVILVCLP